MPKRARRTSAGTARSKRNHGPGQLNIVLILGVLCSVVFLKNYQVDSRSSTLAWMQQPAMILLALISFTHGSQKKERAHKHGDIDFKSPREHNAFTFSAMIEVAVLFAGIFITMTPAICLLKAHGAETGVTMPGSSSGCPGA